MYYCYSIIGLVSIVTMYDFPDSSAIFDIFEVGHANSHILVRNHLATPKLAIFEQWRPDWRSGGRQFGNLAIFGIIFIFLWETILKKINA